MDHIVVEKPPLVLAVCGSRGYPDLETVKSFVKDWHQVLGDRLRVVTGGAQGVDSAAEEVANELGIPVEVFPAEWERYGKGAGLKRNKDIVKKADVVVLFWDGQSKGTAHTLELARKSGKAYYLFGPRPPTVVDLTAVDLEEGEESGGA